MKIQSSQSQTFRLESIIGSRKLINYFWAFSIFLGAFGFLIAGISSYLKKNVFFSTENILFIPQGAVMCFYGIAGIFLSFYLWFTIILGVGSGFNEFNKNEGIIRIFRWGFPGKNRRIKISFFIKDIKSIRIDVRDGIYPRSILYLKIRGMPDIPLDLTENKFNLNEIEKRATELAYFLRVPIEGLE
uniref:Photosystem I assembly protein Ycf4 n=1 Tax=Nitellopsis obtusa TaxID=40811 RepID=A0A8F6YEW1_9VIRI|nr:photosystem I assembly protein Ycf4 [Nitellopsis obtusa]